MQTGSVIYIVLLVVAFYFLLIRPQQVRQRQVRELMAALSTGDRVITIGGVHGTVVRTEEMTVVLRMIDGSEIEFEKAAVAKIVTDIPLLPDEAGTTVGEPADGPQDAPDIIDRG